MLNLTIIRIDDGSLEAHSGFFSEESNFGCFMLNIMLDKKKLTPKKRGVQLSVSG